MSIISTVVRHIEQLVLLVRSRVISIDPLVEKLRNLHLRTETIESSTKQFSDGTQFKVEIPSIEGPKVLRAVLEESEYRHVPIDRISQGSGGFMLTNHDVASMVTDTHKRDIALLLFARPQAGWGVDAGASYPDTAMAAQASGWEQVAHNLQDISRMARLGVNGALVTDLGVLKAVNVLKYKNILPREFELKGSIQMGLINPVSISLAEELGLTSYNISSDVALSNLADIRKIVDLPLDIYIEAPENMGGFVRYYEIAEIIRIASPVYLKFGVRNAPNIYPNGRHLEDLTINLARERVRRAQIGLEMLSEIHRN